MKGKLAQLLSLIHSLTLTHLTHSTHLSEQKSWLSKVICAELNLHQMGLTSQVSAPENLASSGDHCQESQFSQNNLAHIMPVLCCSNYKLRRVHADKNEIRVEGVRASINATLLNGRVN